eukprot:CAMPEP_0172407818 /NCGR_PEP_ID=MMETSP1061-20121228/75534_1 /TAXON_ID=37318 /ORGANISM="Pseudo-nitzschia pungens, Strain cf. pungens" /LENGTH=136 /DNA_ID=CAMNT_0013143927 /DNA_START=66 /DNA_END=476 /DNA_ORIENTATION=+
MQPSSVRFLYSALIFAFGIILVQVGSADAFLSGPGLTSAISASECSRNMALKMSDREEDDAKSRLRDLGFSDTEIERSNRPPQKEQMKVRVDMVDNVDAATLTAVGFGLVAFNFFVLANMGDGGIGAIVATIINSF